MGDWCLLCRCCHGLFSCRIWLADGLAGPERDVIRKCGFIYSRIIVGNLCVGFFGGVGFPQGHDGAEPLWARSARATIPAAARLNRGSLGGEASWRSGVGAPLRNITASAGPAQTAGIPGTELISGGLTGALW